jgi:hypothetical protein
MAVVESVRNPAAGLTGRSGDTRGAEGGLTTKNSKLRKRGRLRPQVESRRPVLVPGILPPLLKEITDRDPLNLHFGPSG